MRSNVLLGAVGWAKKPIRRIGFLGRVLPEEMTKSFHHRVEELRQESKMKYVTSIERLGRREGRQEGLREVVLAQLEEKFGPPEAPILRRIEEAAPEQILLWAKKLLTASSQDEVFAT